MSTSSTTYFNGQSTYSADLNHVISRTIAIATLPITLLENRQSTLANQQSEIQTLGADFMAVQSAIDGLNTAYASNSFVAAVDVPAIAGATVSSGAQAGNYALNISSLGTQTNTISVSAATRITDPSSQGIPSSANLSLAVNGTNYSLPSAGVSLNSLVAAINASGAPVQATVVNVGGSASPDYRLSVQSNQYAPDTIQISDGTNSMLTTFSTGSYVTYQVNGQPSTPIDSSSRTLSLSTGLTATAIQTGIVNINVSQSGTGISGALSTLVKAYNSAVDELKKNHGQNGGALQGDSLISRLQSSLNALATYRSLSSTKVNSIADLGLAFDQAGHLQLDSATFNAIASSSLSDVLNFLGSETGSGFVQSAYSSIISLTDSTSGTITKAGTSVGTSFSNLTSEIAAKQAQVTQLQSKLTTQMAQADAALSSLEGQVTEITNLFTAQAQASRNITG